MPKASWLGNCSLSFLICTMSVGHFARAADARQQADSRWYQGIRIERLELGQVPNLSTFGEHVYFAGQPREEDFTLFAQKGVRTVINLRTEREMRRLGFDEEAVVKKAGMAYLNVPIAGDLPSDEEFKTIRSVLEGAKDERVLLHCASSNRVGFVWSLFRAVQHKLPIEAALAEGKAAGLRSPALEGKARKYIGQKNNRP